MNLSAVVGCTFRSGPTGAVVHSFDGSANDLQSFLAFERLFIGAVSVMVFYPRGYMM